MRGSALAVVAVLAGGCDPQDEESANTAPAASAETAPSPGGPAPALGAMVSAAVDEARASSQAFIPADATAVFGIDVSTLTRSELVLRGFEALVGKSLTGDDRRDFDDLAECGIDYKAIRRAVVATNEGDTAMTVNGPRLGDLEVYRCFLGRAEARGNPDGFAITVDGPRPKLHLEDGDVGFLLGPETLVIAEKTWASKLEAELAAPARALRRPSPALVALIGATDEDAAAWWAIDADSAKLGMSPLGTFEGVRGHLAVADAFEFSIWLETPSHDDATRTRDELQKQFDGMKSMLTSFGLSSALVASIAFTTDDDDVKIRFDLTDDDLRFMQEQFGSSF